ncbi:TetR/AcrR family transcriptional regulator C-terminal domain-containing protein [Microbacterium sp. NPDC078814]|uniref:TetR/AcrR family transcriptional regulator C-terminal domain-containing protein n=1 Tax=Microbacterium sp. NPDC078814 TaxID=3154767 RepID=UPI00344D55EE
MAGTKRMTRRDVVHAALHALDEGGVDAVTLRGVARALGVHLNSVSLQVGTKARLLDLMADAILGELNLEDLPADPIERVKEIFRRYRTVLLAHRDGAHLVSGTRVFELNTLALGEAVISGLIAAHVHDQLAVRTFWGLNYFVVGLVHEEQVSQDAGGRRFDSDVSPTDYPALAAVRDFLLDDPFEARLEFGLDALLHRAKHQDD